MHRHDGRGPGGDGRLDAVGVDAAVRRVDVHEHGLDAVPPDRVGGGHEAERGGYHLTGYAQGLEGCYQRQCAVGEEADEGNLKVLAQGGLQFLVVMPVVGYPLARPDVPQVCVEFVQVRKERGRDGDLNVVHLFLLLVSSEESKCGVLYLQIFGQPESLAKADDDGGACAQLHQQHPYRLQVQERQRPDAGGHHGGYAERRQDVPYLGLYRVAYEGAGISGVEEIRDDACDQRAPQHPVDVDEYSQQQRSDGYYLLHYLQLQEQVRPALNLKHVQIDCVKRIQ